MKRIGLAVLMAALAPSAFAAGTYSEVWNPPEARATIPRKGSVAHTLPAHRHIVPHAMKVHARRATTLAPKLMAKQSHVQKSIPADKPDMSDIPRQITPEGNVLRVTTRGAAVEVTR
ncbi:hypothetical protein LMG22037_06531 [Paraburkholderia phenoliruptrix]|uniref:Uncharacterized protein n=1 Tax=Paraburkholderia phenoliruptrix TaxID=252970 RepID=A0A6J5CNQ0_9BURK|nr:hypothetical protein [Paraburkholderia phenoliruptrix]CAB3741826.1 hypothetical protein LMG22037_06531 [Paraburkholderia phenoliruptrix]